MAVSPPPALIVLPAFGSRPDGCIPLDEWRLHFAENRLSLTGIPPHGLTDLLPRPLTPGQALAVCAILGHPLKAIQLARNLLRESNYCIAPDLVALLEAWLMAHTHLNWPYGDVLVAQTVAALRSHIDPAKLDAATSAAIGDTLGAATMSIQKRLEREGASK